LKAHVFEVDHSLLFHNIGQAFEKCADVQFSGLLQISKEGALVVAVPASLVRGIFDALHEPGISLPTHDNNPKVVRATITVMTPEEVTAAGGAAAIVERGRSYRYTMQGLVKLPAKNWPGVAHCWHMRIRSPELTQLRVSYGLDRKLNMGKDDFSIVVAYRKIGVLAENAVTRTLDSWLAAVSSGVLPPWAGTRKQQKPVS
jgi:hypothetical protein